MFSRLWLSVLLFISTQTGHSAEETSVLLATPNELKAVICSFLGIKDVVTLKSVNHHFENFVIHHPMAIEVCPPNDGVLDKEFSILCDYKSMPIKVVSLSGQFHNVSHMQQFVAKLPQFASTLRELKIGLRIPDPEISSGRAFLCMGVNTIDIGELPNLSSLELESSVALNQQGIARLATMKKLKKVVYNPDRPYSDKAFSVLCECKGLGFLSINSLQFDNVDMISFPKDLETIEIDNVIKKDEKDLIIKSLLQLSRVKNITLHMVLGSDHIKTLSENPVFLSQVQSLTFEAATDYQVKNLYPAIAFAKNFNGDVYITLSTDTMGGCFSVKALRPHKEKKTMASSITLVVPDQENLNVIQNKFQKDGISECTLVLDKTR